MRRRIEQRDQQGLALLGGARLQEYPRGRGVGVHPEQVRAAVGHTRLPEEPFGASCQRARFVLRSKHQARPGELAQAAHDFAGSADPLARREAAFEDLRSTRGCPEVEKC